MNLVVPFVRRVLFARFLLKRFGRTYLHVVYESTLLEGRHF